MSADDYDGFAEDYEAENATSLLNAYYERPAVLGLVGDAQGKRILDAGCGSGPLAAELVARGADVTGFDGSPAMIDLARRRLGGTVPLTVHDLAEPLPYEDESASRPLRPSRCWSGVVASSTWNS
jgi:ubiquinone/menaquinone biosynthesis C-methylase UbiE